MNLKKYFILTLLFCGCFALSAQKRVAVSPTSGSVDAGVKGALTEAILEGISYSGKYIIVERANFSQIQQEQAFQASGNVDDEQIAEVGRIAGAEYVCISSINKIGANYLINYRLVDVVSGLVIDKQKRTATETNLMEIIMSISQERLFDVAVKSNTGSACGLEIQKTDAGEGMLNKRDQKKVSSEGWRLPTISELKCMCKEKEKIGGFNYGEYWSSESNTGYGIGIRFNSCSETKITNKASIRYVR